MAHIVNVAEFRSVNPLKPNDPYSGRTAPLTSKRCILYIYSTNIGSEYFKHGIYSPFFPHQNAVSFIILTYLVPVLFTFYIQGVLKLKKNNSGAKRLILLTQSRRVGCSVRFYFPAGCCVGKTHCTFVFRYSRARILACQLRSLCRQSMRYYFN